jgi:hypothetical protein
MKLLAENTYTLLQQLAEQNIRMVVVGGVTQDDHRGKFMYLHEGGILIYPPVTTQKRRILHPANNLITTVSYILRRKEGESKRWDVICKHYEENGKKKYTQEVRMAFFSKC